jgi:hypothetical protein
MLQSKLRYSVLCGLLVLLGCEPGVETSPQKVNDESIGSGLLKTSKGSSTVVLVDANGDSSLVSTIGAYSVLQTRGLEIFLPANEGQLSLSLKTPTFGVQVLGGEVNNPFGGYFSNQRSQLWGLDGQFELITLDSITHLATFTFSGRVSLTRSNMPRDTITMCGIANQLDFVSNLSEGTMLELSSLGKYFIKNDSLWIRGGVEQPGARSFKVSIPQASRGIIFPSSTGSRPIGEWSIYDWDFHEKKMISITNPFPRDGDSIVITKLDLHAHQVSGWLTGAGDPRRRPFTSVNISVLKD